MNTTSIAFHNKVRKMWLNGATKETINDLLTSKGLKHQQIGAFHNVHRQIRAEVYNEVFKLLHKSTAKRKKQIKYEDRWLDENCPMKRKLENWLLTRLQKLGFVNALILPSTNPDGQYEKYTRFGFTKLIGVERDPKIYAKYENDSPFPYLLGEYDEIMKQVNQKYYFAGDYCAMCATEGETFFKNLPKGAKWSYTLGDYNRQVNGETRLDRLKMVGKLLGGKAKNIKEIPNHGGEYLEHSKFTVKGKRYAFHCYKETGKAKPMMVITNF